LWSLMTKGERNYTKIDKIGEVIKEGDQLKFLKHTSRGASS